MPCSQGIAFSLKYSHMNDLRQPAARSLAASGSSERPCIAARSRALPPASSTSVGAMSSASTMRLRCAPGVKRRG